MASPRFVRFEAGRCEWVGLAARPGGGGLAVRCGNAAGHRPPDGCWYCDEHQAEADANERLAAERRKGRAV